MSANSSAIQVVEVRFQPVRGGQCVIQLNEVSSPKLRANSEDSGPTVYHLTDGRPSGAQMLQLRSWLLKHGKPRYSYWWKGHPAGESLEKVCTSVSEGLEQRETKGRSWHEVGSAGRLGGGKTFSENSPELLTFPGMVSLEPILDVLDRTRRRYMQTMQFKSNTQMLDRRRVEVHKRAEALWKSFSVAKPGTKEQQSNALKAFRAELAKQKLTPDTLDLGAIPRVLILGESGTGKTLISRYLANRADPIVGDRVERPMRRLPIPGFLGAEDRFEWDLFGYLPGSFTGGRVEGSFGSALELIGGLLFLDEIGEASPALQAKMLAFMDDFEVAPRGWEGEGFACPLMLIAATNRDVRKWAQQGLDGEDSVGFRHDLYWRFDTVIELPSLNSRKHLEMPAIVDSLLQVSSVNPGLRVRNVETEVFQKLVAVDYKNSNFRLLSRMLKEAIQRCPGDSLRATHLDPVLLPRPAKSQGNS